MEITNDIKYIGVNDHRIDLFEGQYIVPHGMAYNSYVILDERIAVMDTVDGGFCGEWLSKLESALQGRTPDYLIVQHMEPDHSANIAAFAEKYPSAEIVASKQAFAMMKQFFGTDYPERQRIVGEKDTLPLGRHTLSFIAAPMVHWPEVIMTYDSTDKALFTADGFGKFGALDIDEDWDCEARRYYFGIVGKYGAQVQALLKKAAALEIGIICPLHGPVLKENLAHYIGQYNTWSSYAAEDEGVVIAYASVYGNTRKAAEILASALADKGCRAVLHDLARDDLAECIEDAFRYSKLVLCSPTYNADIFPFMRYFIEGLTERNYQNRKIGLVENGSWAPTAAKVMRAMFEKSRNITFADTVVTIRSAVSDESKAQISALADEMA